MQKKAFTIVTDSGCDMPKEYLKKHGVKKLPLSFTIEGKTYQDEELSTEAFYQKLLEGALPVTHQATPEQVKELLTPILQAKKDVLAIAFSSGLSGTANSYQCAAKDLSQDFPDRKILVVDSLSASMGQGLLLDYAVNYAAQGKDIEETKAYLEKIKGKIAHVFTVDNLFHLKRGGRVSGVTAFIGTVLKIKPVMHVDDNGKLVAVQKCMGRKKALQTMIERVENTQALTLGEPIFVSHASAREEAEILAAKLKEKFPSNPVTVGEIGAVIGAHAGAGTLAVFYKAKKR